MNLDNLKVPQKKLDKLMNRSPKIKQARDVYFRKILKTNLEKLKTLLKY